MAPSDVVFLLLFSITFVVVIRATTPTNSQDDQQDPKITFEIRIPEPEVQVPFRARQQVDETTHLVYVDEHNEAGVLWAELKAAASAASAATTTASNGSGRAFEGASGPANFSVYLISRHKQHLAILLDIEEITFEPMINCEYQELKFSIVGEISKQLLEQRKNGSAPLSGPEVGGDERGPTVGGEMLEPEVGTEFREAEAEVEAAAAAAAAGPQVPVSEAMALLLNAPLNLTLLDDSPELNDFRLIDQTIDFLYGETCRELLANQTAGSDASPDTKPRTKQRRQRRRKSSNKAHKARGRKQRPEVGGGDCEARQEEGEFRQKLARKLDEQLEWDDFKIVCGRTRQLVIPMRSVKLSVSSDEFSPSSKFAIKYQFVSNASQLPALDNGKYFCRNRKVISLNRKCDGYDDCGDASDESVKICGFPTGRQATASTGATGARRPTSGGSGREALKLHYFQAVDSNVLQCCQSSQWQQALGLNSAQPINLQSLIGESMKLFSGPLFAPTKAKRRFKRIVGGTQAHRGAWPGQASLQYELLEPLCHFCAGTLIHPQYVLTAGHCITKEGLGRGIKVVFGAHDLRQLNASETPGIQTRYVDDAQIYPGVDVKQLSFDWENDMNNDIALLRLNAPVLISAHVAPACLPPFNTPLQVNTTCRSIGWGQTHGSGNSNLLKHLPLRVVESSECSRELLDREDQEREKQTASTSMDNGEFDTSTLDIYNNHTMICVNNDHGHGICQGDSGGPLYCDRQLSSGEVCTEIYGVASFIIQYATVGAMCAVENLPGIFGEVSSKTDWVSSTIKMFEQSYRLKYGQHKINN